MSTQNEGQHAQSQQAVSSAPAMSPRPVYHKPTIRKYDQIEQVKPYGPSEKQAG